MSSKYKEIFRLKDMLDEANIEYEFLDRSLKDEELLKNIRELDSDFSFESYQICCPNSENRYISIIEGFRNVWRTIRQTRNNGLINKERS